MFGYSNFETTNDWAKDIAHYAMVCQGHVRTLEQRREAKRSVPFLSEPTGQIAQIRDAEIAALEAGRDFWDRQDTAAGAGYLLEDGGTDPEWASRHQSLRAEAIKFARIIHRQEFDAYVATAFSPKDY